MITKSAPNCWAILNFFSLLKVIITFAAYGIAANDICFCYAPITQPELASLTILSEPLVVVLPPDHPLLLQEQIELRSLHAESFILYPQNIKPDVRRQSYSTQPE